MNSAERDLVARASRGDVEAFSKLVQAHSNLVHRVALRMLGSEEAKDASQEVWVRVWANMKSFRGDSTFSTWLYRITVNTCLSFGRRVSRRRECEVSEETPYLSEPLGRDADPEAEALNSERREALWVALRRVRVEHRTALVLRHMEGLSYAEIAKVLEVPEGTAKGWVSRGRAAMLVVLTEENHDRQPTPVNQKDTGPYVTHGEASLPPQRRATHRDAEFDTANRPGSCTIDNQEPQAVRRLPQSYSQKPS